MPVQDLHSLRLASYGQDVRIYSSARLLDPHQIRIGDHVVIDDFVLLQGGAGMSLGCHVHVASFVSITGGGITELDDFAGVSSGTRVLTGSDVFDGTGLTGPTIPAEMRSVERTFVRIGRYAVVGANAVVHPGVTIGEGAIIGSGGVVLKDVEPWSINVGMPTRAVGARPKERVLELGDRLLNNG